MRAWACWQGVRTQWRVGMGGVSGLDYAGVRSYLLDQGLTRDERRDVMRGIQACEAATLEVWAEQREQEASRQQQPMSPFPTLPGL